MTRMRMGTLLAMLIAGTTAGAVDIPAIIDATDPMPEDLGVVHEHRDFEDPALEAIWRRNELRDHAQALTDLETYLAHAPEGPSKLRARYFAVRWHLQLHKYDLVEHRFADLQAAVTHANALIEAAPEYPLTPDAVLPAVEQALYWGTADSTQVSASTDETREEGPPLKGVPASSRVGDVLPTPSGAADPIEGRRWAVFGAADERAKADAVFWDTVFETAARYVGRYPATPGAPRVLLALGYFLRQTPEGKAQAEAVFQRLAAWPRDAYSERAIAYKALHDFALERGDVAKATALAEEGMRECAGRLAYRDEGYFRDYAVDYWPKAAAGTPWARLAETGVNSNGVVVLQRPEWIPGQLFAFDVKYERRNSETGKWAPSNNEFPGVSDAVANLQPDRKNGMWTGRYSADPAQDALEGNEKVLDELPAFGPTPSPHLLVLPRFPVREGLELVPLADGRLMRQLARREGEDVLVTLSLVERIRVEQIWKKSQPWWNSATIEDNKIYEETFPAGPIPGSYDQAHEYYSICRRIQLKRTEQTPDPETVRDRVGAVYYPPYSPPAPPEPPGPVVSEGTGPLAHFHEKERWTPEPNSAAVRYGSVLQQVDGRPLVLIRLEDGGREVIDLDGRPVELNEDQMRLFERPKVFAQREECLYTTEADRISAEKVDGTVQWTYQAPLDRSTTLPTEKIDFPDVVAPILIHTEVPYLFFGVRQRQVVGYVSDEARGGGVIALELDGSERYNRSDLGYVDAVTVDTASPKPTAYALVQRRTGEFEQAHFLVALIPATGETLWEHHLYTLHDEFVRTLDRSIALVRGTAPLLAVSLGIMNGGSYSDYPRSIRLYTLDGEPRGSIRKAVLNHVADFDGDGTDELLIRRAHERIWDSEIVTPPGEVLWQAPGKGGRWWVQAVGQFDAKPGADLVVRERDTFILLGNGE